MIRILASAGLTSTDGKVDPAKMDIFLAEYKQSLNGSPSALTRPDSIKVTTGDTPEKLLSGYGKVVNDRFDVAKFTDTQK
jgi:hypothetical protein